MMKLEFAILLILAVRCSANETMKIHTEGRKPQVNVYSAIDSRRPLIGVHICIERSMQPVLPHLTDVFDFVTHDQHQDWIPEALDEARLPWVELFHNYIPIGSWDKEHWDYRGMGAKLHAIQETHKYCLGFDTGSEPHFSPDYHYTSHKKEDIDSLITRPESSRDFGDWMAGLYGDESPSEDTNGDGITFEKDFGFTSDKWETVGTAMPSDSPHREFLRTLFKEYLIRQVIVGMDRYYHGIYTDKLIITSRLLSIPYTPTFGQSMRQLKSPADAVGVTHYVFEYLGQKDLQGNDVKHRFALFAPVVVELASSCIYQQALRTGRRVFYNEFQSGSPDGNTPDNVYRAVFHELQFRPAAINYFAYSTSDVWDWFNCSRIATELAALRGQLELMTPYEHILRPQRDLAVFIPPANPESARDPEVAKVENEQWTILKTMSKDLVKYGPDVLLTEQLDKFEAYKSIILVLGFTDGPTDTYLAELLKDVPADKKILVLCSKTQLFCEPGRRKSPDFTHALLDVLPISPMGGLPAKVSFDVSKKKVELSVTPNVHRNPNVTDGMWIEAGGQTVGWQRGNLMVLAGIPTSGCDALMESFFGLEAPNMRSAGMLHILNRDAAAREPGYYCFERGQSLTIEKNLVGYDLPRRKPVKGVVSEPGIVWVLDPQRLQIVDAGSAVIRLESEKKDRVQLQVRMPGYKFPKPIKPELVIANLGAPKVTLNGKSLPVAHIPGTSFYRCAITEDGTCIVGG